MGDTSDRRSPHAETQTVSSEFWESTDGTGDSADRSPHAEYQTVSSEFWESTEGTGDTADRRSPHAESQTVSSDVSEPLGAGDVQGLGLGSGARLVDAVLSLSSW